MADANAKRPLHARSFGIVFGGDDDAKRRMREPKLWGDIDQVRRMVVLREVGSRDDGYVRDGSVSKKDQ